MNITFARLLPAALIAAAFSCAAPPLLAAQASASRPPVEAFFENSNFGSPKLSPNGRYLAARVAKPGERDRLSVVNLEDMSVKVVAMFSDADVGRFDWVNDERLVFTGRDKRVTASDDDKPNGIFAVNRDGSGFLQLSETSFGRDTTGTHLASRMLSWNHYLLGVHSRRNSNQVYVVKYLPSPNYTAVKVRTLLLLDTVTGLTTPISTPGPAIGWVMDQNGEPRITVTEEARKEAIWYREGDGESASWKRLTEYAPYTGETFSPVGFGPDGALYVAARGNGSDKSGLFRYDLQNKALGKEALLAMDDYDMLGDLSAPEGNTLVVRNGKLIGLRYLADVPGVAWLDKDSQALQEKIDQLLPGHVNLIDLPQRPEAPWVLVQSESDAEPDTWLIYNKDSQKLVRVGRRLEHIPAGQMGRRELVHYKARDGLTIPAWLTYPHGSARKNLPTVVLVHGGPWVRGGAWGWDSDAQFLASRGYAVLEPEFRGSTGYGWKLFHAGWKQWGLAMQDDVADGVKWAAAQGISDPQRVCIAGASYGGYAVLMGLIRNPELYRCGFEWVGVTDIKLMYTGNWSADSDLPERWKQFGMPALIGDQEKDAAQLQETSPLAQAARIKAPLLLAYGTDDHRVPLYHGEKFYAAVKASNPNVEWVTYEKEGHGWMLPKNRYDWWTRVEKFLDKQIGSEAK